MNKTIARVYSLLFFSSILAGVASAQGHLGGPLPFGTTNTVPINGTTGQFPGLENHSPFNMVISGPRTITNGPFTLTAPQSVGPGGYVTVTGTFNPSDVGLYTAQIHFFYQYQYPGNGGVDVQIGASGNYVIPGYINPKYVVVGVVYAPPGSNSNVNYTNSNLVSNTQTVTHTFISKVSESVSVTGPGGLFGFLGGTRTSSNSNTLTQQSQDSTSVTASYTTTSSLQLYGPGPKNNCGPEANDFIGVDHNCDLIKVWVNPVMLFTLTGPSSVQWNGYGFSELDNVAPIHIVDVLVGCLNGHLAASDSRCAPPLGEFQRSWAANENWPSGEGPGLTATDLSKILAADPWGQCPADAPIGSSACPTYSSPGFVLLPPQFTISDKSNVPYRQGAPGTGWSVNTTNSTTQSQESKTTYEQTFGIEDAFMGSGFLKGFGAKVSVMQTLSTAYEVQNSTTVSNTFAGMANITGPACNGNPCNPAYPPPPSQQTYGAATEVDIFVDNFFGTFAFVPSAYN